MCIRDRVVDDGYDDKAEELLNGHEPAGNLRGGKYSAFEGGTRVPVIVHWPKACLLYTSIDNPIRTTVLDTLTNVVNAIDIHRKFH